MTQLEEQAILLTQICTDSAIQPRLERNRRWIKALAQAMVGSVMVTAFTRILNDIERQKNI